MSESPATPEAESPRTEEFPAYSADGVDLTLIRWMLSLTPAERLLILQENLRSILELRGEATET